MSQSNSSDERGYHSQGGFYFKRVRGPVDGEVIVSYWRGNDRIDSVLLTESEWASVVAAVSALGEDGSTWQAARDFHAGRYLDVGDLDIGDLDVGGHPQPDPRRSEPTS